VLNNFIFLWNLVVAIRKFASVARGILIYLPTHYFKQIMHQQPLKMLTCPKKNGNDGTYDQYYLPDFVALSNTTKYKHTLGGSKSKKKKQ